MKHTAAVALMLVALLASALAPAARAGDGPPPSGTVNTPQNPAASSPQAQAGELRLGLPDYDSGWQDIDPDEGKTFNHNLGGDPDDYVIQVLAQGAGGFVVNVPDHQCDHGGNHFYRQGQLEKHGYSWFGLDDSQIVVYRWPDDIQAHRIRVRIWVIPWSAYDSGWRDVDQGQILTLQHDLGGDTDDYLVDLQFEDDDHDVGVNIIKYGLDVYYDDGKHLMENGAAWQELTTSAITVRRGQQDIYADRVRVRIWRVAEPDYDSGWQTIGQDETKRFQHDLGGPWADYFFDLQFAPQGGYAVHQTHYGGNTFRFEGNDLEYGAALSILDSRTAEIHRGADDRLANKVRLRIWAERQPHYDSGWTALDPGEVRTFDHGLGGSEEDYVVDLQFRDDGGGEGTWGVNQIFLGTNSARDEQGQEHWEGGYWQHLTNSQIQVRRNVDDEGADEVRVRIWIPPDPAYDSFWHTVDHHDAQMQFDHGLAGDPNDYVVYLEADGASGVTNQDYGINTHAAFPQRGAGWRELTAQSIKVDLGQGLPPEKVRVRIWRSPPPDYDSNWIGLETWGNKTLDHELGDAPENYVLDFSFKDSAGGGLGAGINQRAYGGDTWYDDAGTAWRSQGAHWRELTSDQVTLWREGNDPFADRVRVRIWKTRACYSVGVKIDPLASGRVTFDPPHNCDSGSGYLEGTVIELTAEPSAGYGFDQWSTPYGATFTDNPQRLMVDGDAVITAHFKPGGTCHTLDLNFDCLRAGCSIGYSPPSCPGGEGYLEGTVVTVTAYDNATHTFDHWSGDATGSANAIQVTMDADKQVSGHWTWIGPCYTLDLSVDPPGAGQATAHKPPDCDGRPGYPEGDSVKLTAKPNPGYDLNFWGEHTGANFFDNPLWYTISEDASLIAHFESTDAKTKVLFDEAHDERNTLDWVRAQELSKTLPWHPEPEWQFFGELQAGLADEFTLERNADAPLAPSLLGHYDALILAAPESALSEAERGAVGAFVRSGGGLLILGDCGLDQPDDHFWATVYDLHFEAACLFAPVPQANGNIPVTDFAKHDAVQGLEQYQTNWGTSIWTTRAGEATQLAWTEANTWEDTDGSGDYSAGDATGVFPVAAGYDAGCGRVAGVSDNAFQDEGSYGQDNEPLMRSLLRWVTGGQPCALDERAYLPLALR